MSDDFIISAVASLAFLLSVGGMAIACPRRAMQCFTFSNASWSLFYFLLGEISGSAVCLVNLIRTIGGVYASDRIMQYLMPIYMVLVVIIAMISYTGLYSLLPCIGSLAMATSVYYRDKAHYFRISQLAGLGCWFAYALILSSALFMASSFLQIAVCLWAIYRYDLAAWRDLLIGRWVAIAALRRF